MNLLAIKKMRVKNRLISIFAFLIILDLVIIYFFIFPTINKIKSTRNEIINLKIDLENKVTREKNMADLNQKIKKIEPQLEKINQIFVNENREIEFITALEDLEKKYKVTQTLNLEVNNKQKGENFTKVPIHLEVKGSFSDLMNYLNGIESLSYYVNISNISLEKSETAQISMKINGSTYWK